MKNYRLAPIELRRLQMKKLRWMLRYCYDYVPLYHDWIRGSGLAPEEIQDVKDLRRLPRLSRKSLYENYPDRIVPSSARVALRMETSGTTGRPLRISWSPRFSDTRTGLTFRRTWVDGVRPWHKGAVVWTGSSAETPTQTRAFTKSVVFWYRVLLGAGDPRILVFRQAQLFVPRGGWKASASYLYGLRPDVLYSRPSHARRLGLKLEEEGRKLNLRFVLTSGEFLSEGIREDLEALYSAEVFDSYGSNEFGGLGFECPEHSGTHLNSDCFLFEVLRDGEEVAPGESGEIVITALHNEAMPLIRYEQGDQVVLAEEGKCGCGSYLLRLQAIQGRLGDGLMTAEGRRIPSGPVCDQFERVLGMRDFQLTQKDHQRMTLKLVAKYRTEVIETEVSNYLKNLVGDDLTLEIEEWSEDDMPAKYRPVMSEIA